MIMLRRVLDASYQAAAILAAVCIALVALLITAGIVARGFGLPMVSSEDIAGFLLAASTFLALPITQHTGTHIRVTLAIRHLPASWRRAQEALVLFVGALLVAALAAAAIRLVLDSFRYGDMSTGQIAIPLWIPQLPMALGLLLFNVSLLDALSRTLHASAFHTRTERRTK